MQTYQQGEPLTKWTEGGSPLTYPRAAAQIKEDGKADWSTSKNKGLHSDDKSIKFITKKDGL